MGRGGNGVLYPMVFWRAAYLIREAFTEKEQTHSSQSPWHWHPGEVEGLFDKVILLASSARPIIIFMNALDEAGASTSHHLAQYFQHLDARLAAGSATARLCISCRHYPVPSNNMLLQVSVEEENANDNALYIKDTFRSGLAAQDKTAFPIEAYQVLEDHIREGALGVFQWAVLVIGLVLDLSRDGDSYAFIKQQFNNIPRGLEQVYRHIFESVVLTQNYPRSLHLFQWVLCAAQPLSIAEMRYAMACDDGPAHDVIQMSSGLDEPNDTDHRFKKLIASLSGGLVEVRSQGSGMIIQFIHHSHDRLAAACINYFKRPEIRIKHAGPDDLEKHDFFWPSAEERNIIAFKYPFILYAAAWWLVHAKRVEEYSTMLRGLKEQHIQPRSLGSCYLKAIQKNWVGSTAVDFAAALGHDLILRMLLLHLSRPELIRARFNDEEIDPTGLISSLPGNAALEAIMEQRYKQGFGRDEGDLTFPFKVATFNVESLDKVVEIPLKWGNSLDDKERQYSVCKESRYQDTEGLGRNIDGKLIPLLQIFELSPDFQDSKHY
ncbi:uncharacterized protein PAC_08575 [Phialocephala subalpina]|uniref:Uncharacterized protein n=1 Tax=Phialocephala subalpina TaxID=576137 RepID=A0A1L7X0Z6_9HELO|nr:uncharacterized protein PAC_08575 [Phialocephala subalpina]